MQNQMIAMLMNQLKAKNPQMFQQIEQLKQNNGNPMELLKQVTNNYDDKTRDAFFQQAKQMGFSDELLNQVQSGINTN